MLFLVVANNFRPSIHGEREQAWPFRLLLESLSVDCYSSSSSSSSLETSTTHARQRKSVGFVVWSTRTPSRRGGHRPAHTWFQLLVSIQIFSRATCLRITVRYFCLPLQTYSPFVRFPSTQTIAQACFCFDIRIGRAFDAFVLVWFGASGSLAVNCAGLTRLNLSGCLGICGPGLAAVGECCPKLVHLDLSDCKQVSNTRVSASGSTAAWVNPRRGSLRDTFRDPSACVTTAYI